MTAPSIAVLILFCLVALFHLITCFGTTPSNSTNTLSNYADLSKPLLMPLLGLVAVMILIPAKATTTAWLISFALLFGMVGDCFLLNAKDSKRFIAGTIAFFTGHVFYLFLFAPAILRLPVWSWIIAGLAAGGITFYSWKSSGGKKNLTGFVVIMYSLMLCVMAFSGIAGTVSHYTSGSLFVLLGAILFMISDSILSATLFTKDFYPSRFIIMATYIIAEICLVTGAVAPAVRY